MNRTIKKLLPALLIFLVGCGIYTDFTTFFNLYFNTRELYYETQEDIAKLTTDPFQLKEPEINSAIKTKLITLQEKTSKILQHESESSYFDDALFISGWAFYYNSDYIKAKRKFHELESLPESDYNLISKMWIGKCELQMRNFETGVNILDEVRDTAIAREDDEVLSDDYKVIIAYQIDREQYDKAIEEGRALIEISGDDELNAKVAYRIGLLYLEENKVQKAADAFESVLDYSPDFETEFYSKFELAKLKKELGFVEESREMFDDLYNTGKYEGFWGDVYYELGLIEYEAENYDKAFNIFTDVNKLYSNTKGAVESQLMLGEIMRNVYADYDSAKVYYDKVKGNNIDPELKEKAEVYSQSITLYINLRNDVKTSDRQITYILNPTEFLRDSLAYQRYLVQSGAVKVDQTISIRDTVSTDTTQIVLSDSTNIADTTTALSQKDSLFAMSDIDLSGFNDDYILEIKPVFPKIGIDSLEVKIAKDYFDLGNLFFIDLLRPDSAYYYYTALLNEFPETRFKPRTYFALGTYYETKGDSTKRDSLYTIVYDDYKTHPIANEAAKKLGKPPLIDESDPAKQEYLKAEAKLENSEFTSALTMLKSLAGNYPESIYKPKSLYTIGWLYENKTNQPDSAAKYYSQIVADYKNSEYASAVRAKVSNYDAELKRIEQEKIATEQKKKEPVNEIPSDSTTTSKPNLTVQDSTSITTPNLTDTDSTSVPAPNLTAQDSTGIPTPNRTVQDSTMKKSKIPDKDIIQPTDTTKTQKE